MIVERKDSDGTPRKRRLWGVALHKEVRTLKADAPELAAWGEPWENVTHPFYAVRIRLLGKSRHVGTRGTPNAAALLYDSALFHLWGFGKNPKPRFNSLRPGDEAPAMLPEVQELQRKLRVECSQNGIDFDALNYNFSQRKVATPDRQSDTPA